MANCEKIILVGFSGSGKTSLINALRASPPEGWALFQDLDELVLKNRGQGVQTLAELIETYGWEQFRLWERQEFESWIKEDGRAILAMGGGAFTPLIYELYGKHPRLRFCHIKASFETCWSRLEKAQVIRPLISLGKEKMAMIYQERVAQFDKINWVLENDKMMSMDELKKQFLEQL